jgi:Tfp pilus assembly protein PilO
MTRVQLLLTALGALLVVVLFWLLLWSPRGEELEDLRAETEDIEMRQQQASARIAQLEAVREEAPQQEARLAAAQSVLPRDSALPGFLRQVQVSADEAGLTLLGVSPARPVPDTVEGGPQGLHRINVTMELEGGYFQLVDFLRRIEDPRITPRGLMWNSLIVSGDPEEHPTLEMSLQGDLFALLPITPEATEVTPPEDAEDDDGSEGDTDADAEADTEDAG